MIDGTTTEWNGSAASPPTPAGPPTAAPPRTTARPPAVVDAAPTRPFPTARATVATLWRQLRATGSEWGGQALAAGAVPDLLLRATIRTLCGVRLRQESRGTLEQRQAALVALLGERRRGPIARHTPEANQQHYEVPTAFYQRVLGPRLKYSGGYWPQGVNTLDRSEDAMVELTCRRARLEDGHRVLDLGCGWGALSLYVAERDPRSRVTAVSSSKTQRAYIEGERDRRKLKNLEVITTDVSDFRPTGTFDRIVSVEMFEHLWNHEALLQRMAGVLASDGRLFIHIFSHRELTYLFEAHGTTDWMARHFFTGGSMLSDQVLLYAQRELVLEDHWRIDGTHYARTAEAWLDNLDAHRAEVMALLAQTYSSAEAPMRFFYWRLFFLACAELFGYHQGKQWLVSHYLFAPRGR
jgi:cyclopropane-fatty-acyl-phospholipid synthase